MAAAAVDQPALETFTLFGSIISLPEKFCPHFVCTSLRLAKGIIFVST